MVSDSSPSRSVRSSGRIDKRNAILDSAFLVFARLGYATACVKEIATEAGVAKPTVYNHMADKETLFRESIEAAAERICTPTVAAVQARLDAVDEVAEILLGVAVQLARAWQDPELWALRRLVSAESGRFPELPDLVKETSIVPIKRALGNKIARWVLNGELRTGEPDLAAAQFIALVVGPLELESASDARHGVGAWPRAVAHEAVTTFLRAFGTAGAASSQTGR